MCLRMLIYILKTTEKFIMKPNFLVQTQIFVKSFDFIQDVYFEK